MKIRNICAKLQLHFPTIRIRVRGNIYLWYIYPVVIGWFIPLWYGSLPTFHASVCQAGCYLPRYTSLPAKQMSVTQEGLGNLNFELRPVPNGFSWFLLTPLSSEFSSCVPQAMDEWGLGCRCFDKCVSGTMVVSYFSVPQWHVTLNIPRAHKE